MKEIRGFLVVLIWACCLGVPTDSAEGSSKRLNTYIQAETLGELSDLVRRHYYEETDPVKLYDGAIEGYLTRLDPHSTYITPDALQQTNERLRGSFEGIGIYFEVIGGFLTVLSPIEGSPAYEVGLLPGDRIVKIDGRSSIGIKAAEVTRRLKGPKGSQVVVDVQRDGVDKVQAFEIVRAKIEIPSVPYSFEVAPGVGYVKINRFSTHTSRDLRDALTKLKEEEIQSLVIDLRGNGGGYLDAAVRVADQLIEKSEILVYTMGRQKKSREDHFSKDDPNISTDVPLIVLVDSRSASASEIVAGAVQDHDRGLVIGRTTFGKGLVQKQYGLKNGGAVLLTVARYFTPSDRPIQRPFEEDRRKYVEEAHDAYDPNADPDSLQAKPVFYTRILHRKVYGEGGITPDITLGKDSLNAFEKRLKRSYFYEFAGEHAYSSTRDHSDFDSFFRRWEAGGRELAAFRKLLREKGMKFTEREMKTGLTRIKREIKRQFAQMRWGAAAAGRVAASQDSELVQALQYFDEAGKLLADRNYYVHRGAARSPSTGLQGRIR